MVPGTEMGFYIIIRGPAGAGKTGIAKAVARKLGADYVSIDEMLREEGADRIEGGCISEENFRKANRAAVRKVSRTLESGGIAVFDGNFYHRSQLEHLKTCLPYRHMVFTLTASLDECVRRDSKRPGGLGEEAVKAVYGMVSTVKAGAEIPVGGKGQEEAADEIVSLIPEDVRKRGP